LSPKIVVVAPTNGYGSRPVVRWTLHMRPERCCDEPVGVPTVFPLLPPAERGWAGEGPADGGPLLLGVKTSFVSSSASCLFELAMLLWLLLASAR
jgi:hypothetical protein